MNKYKSLIETLDPKQGECYACFSRDDAVVAIFHVKKVEQGQCTWNPPTIYIEGVKKIKRGFQRFDSVLTESKMKEWNKVVQAEAERFFRLDKAIGMVNLQFDSYGKDISKQAEEQI